MHWLLLLQGDDSSDLAPDSPSGAAAATWAGTPGRTYTYGELAAATQVGWAEPPVALLGPREDYSSEAAAPRVALSGSGMLGRPIRW